MADGARHPNLYVVGAGKAGTSSVYRYLKQHPEVYAPPVKELHFFGRDLGVDHMPYSRDEDAYLAMFADWGTEPWAIDVSPSYLISYTAPEEIQQVRPDARILILLRNPLEMIPALHSQFLQGGIEPIRDFDEALRRSREATPDEVRWQPLARGQRYPYEQAGHLGAQVDRWLEVFPREQVLIVLFDDLRADTPGTMRRVFEWMGVDADVEVDLTPRNPNVAVGSVRLQRLVHFPPGSMQRVVRAVAPPRVRLALRHFALRRNQTEASRQELSDATRRHLCEVYREDVQRLEEVTGRDLSAWITA